MFVRSIRSAVSLLVAMTILLGIAYPLLITGIAKLAFPRQAEGSLVHADGKLIGSTLIGQSFSDPKYFWGRPSATTPQPYNGLASTPSNLGPLNPALAITNFPDLREWLANYREVGRTRFSIIYKLK